MKKKGKGTIEIRGSKKFVRVFLPDGTRPRYELPEGLSDKELERLAQAISERKRQRVRVEIDHSKLARITVREFGKLWTSGELYRRYGEVRGLKPKKSADVDAYRLERHVYPYLGDVPVADVSEVDIEHVMVEAAVAAERRRGKPWSQGSKQQLFQVLHRLFDLAIKPGRIRPDSPVEVDLKPGRAAPKLYPYLFPDEFVALLACKDVPLERRVLYALAVYTGLRKGSLRVLRWGGIDFKYGTLTSLESKTGLPQMFEIFPGLLWVLQGWFERRAKPGPEELVVIGTKHRRGHEADALRNDLGLSGVDRQLLFSTANNVMRLRFHDLRATFVTWALRQGRGKGWITDRTGHVTEEQMQRYARAARTLADLQIDPFPDLTNKIPEFTDLPENVRRVKFGK